MELISRKRNVYKYDGVDIISYTHARITEAYNSITWISYHFAFEILKPKKETIL